MDGKNKYYNRPVLVLRKFNKQIFWGIPLTTKIKTSPHYHQIKIHGKEQSAMLTQLRLFDSTRITHKMGKLHRNEFQKVQEAVVNSVWKQKKAPLNRGFLLVRPAEAGQHVPSTNLYVYYILFFLLNERQNIFEKARLNSK